MLGDNDRANQLGKHVRYHWGVEYGLPILHLVIGANHPSRLEAVNLSLGVNIDGVSPHP